MALINDYPQMNVDEFNVTVRQLSKIYDIVRAVDPSRQQVVIYHSNGTKEIAEGHYCFNSWNKNGRCRNCVSATAIQDHSRITKFEFIDKDIFHVTAQYITINNEPAVLEIVQKSSDASLEGAFGADYFIDQINNYNEKMYTDSLTQISNRGFYDDQLSSLEMDAIAMIDVDNFKNINDSYGHLCGDEALKLVAQTLRSSVRNEDSVIRYGGDEFLIAFPSITLEPFKKRLDILSEKISQLSVPGHEDLKLSVSIGGVYKRDKVSNLIELADEELYVAKETKNTVSLR